MPSNPSYAGWRKANGDPSASEVLEMLVPGEGSVSGYSRQIHLAQAGDHGTDWGICDKTNPTLVIHAASCPATNFTTLDWTGIQIGGNEVLTLTNVACAVNEVTITNAATGVNPDYAGTGSDTNVGINFTTKGTGQVQIDLGGTFSLAIDDSAVTFGGSVHPVFMGSATGTGNSIAGSNFSLSTGGASAASSSGAGDAGGILDLTTGAGSAGCTTGAGGAGGAMTITTGAGGAAAGCANSGAGGAFTLITGAGAVGQAQNCSTGGASGAISLTTGVGGAGGDACDGGGASGAVTIGSGRGGSGATGEAGSGGNVTLQIGRAGACGTCAVPGQLLVLNDTAGLGVTSVAQCSNTFTSPNLGVGNVFAVTGWSSTTVTPSCTGVMIIETA